MKLDSYTIEQLFAELTHYIKQQGLLLNRVIVRSAFDRAVLQSLVQAQPELKETLHEHLKAAQASVASKDYAAFSSPAFPEAAHPLAAAELEFWLAQAKA